MTNNHKLRPGKTTRQSNPIHPPTKHKADFEPITIDETQKGNCTAIVGGVQPPKPKADFEPVVIDEIVPGDLYWNNRGEPFTK